VKKARGTLVCTTTAVAPAVVETPLTHEVLATIVDAAGDVVATCTVHWRLSPATSATDRV
jgi:hypothetical protein